MRGDESEVEEASIGDARPTLVVGVGASAGGLEALERLFSATPEDSGMAFVVVQHLSPDFESRMDELLSRQHAPADPARDRRDADRAQLDLPDPAAQGDDHVRRAAAADGQGRRPRLQPADRSLLPVARARRGAASGRGRAVGRRQRRLARHPRRARGRGAGRLPDAGLRALPRHAALGDADRRRRSRTACPSRSRRRSSRTRVASRRRPTSRRRSTNDRSTRRWTRCCASCARSPASSSPHYKPSTVLRRDRAAARVDGASDLDAYVDGCARTRTSCTRSTRIC